MKIVLILQFIVMVLIIIAIVLDKIATRRIKEIFAYYEKELEEQYDEIENLKHLKLQEEHNNSCWKSKNRNLRKELEEIENIVYGKRTNEEKVDKIIEVIQSANKNNF